MIPTIAPSAIECQNTKRKIMPSLPSWLVAAVATQIDCASTILPITPPALLAEVIRMGSKCNCSTVMRNVATSGVGFETTGLSREIMRCSGVFHPPLGFPSAVTQEGVVWTFIQSFTGLYPHRKTKRERIRNGTQALKIWLLV